MTSLLMSDVSPPNWWMMCLDVRCLAMCVSWALAAATTRTTTTTTTPTRIIRKGAIGNSGNDKNSRLTAATRPATEQLQAFWLSNFVAYVAWSLSILVCTTLLSCLFVDNSDKCSHVALISGCNSGRSKGKATRVLYFLRFIYVYFTHKYPRNIWP